METQGPTQHEITGILSSVSTEDESALSILLPVIYEELRKLAAGHLRRERANHTLQPTALAHEAYLKLSSQLSARWKSRSHFLSVASTIMRRVLVDHARAHQAEKRGSGKMLTLDAAADAAFIPNVDVSDLDRLLKELAADSERQARVVEMRFFAGMTVEEVAEALGVSEKTVKNDWRFARAWLESRFGTCD